eukprot:gnl/TRDRNA2_/TRDRNA2_88137_c0_seq1.p1 gnl/TRDRNA2_/TRDRNA2_88137_c0~~gnl/TRDRNA2_/TRDRNA2_88137_c0_seq1.p1  ORF type:complete len:219 (-),score=15.72 gnl/TRDRNA2_/TRDRNA2_88137_c0_seq1:593-1249(-)
MAAPLVRTRNGTALQARLLRLLVACEAALMATGRSEKRLTASGPASSVLRLTAKWWSHLDLKDLVGFEGMAPGHLWAGLPQPGEIMGLHSHEHRRQLRESHGVGDMSWVHSLPECVWLILVVVLVVVVFCVTVASAMCLAGELRASDSDDACDACIEAKSQKSSGCYLTLQDELATRFHSSMPPGKGDRDCARPRPFQGIRWLGAFRTKRALNVGMYR